MEEDGRELLSPAFHLFCTQFDRNELVSRPASCETLGSATIRYGNPTSQGYNEISIYYGVTPPPPLPSSFAILASLSVDLLSVLTNNHRAATAMESRRRRFCYLFVELSQFQHCLHAVLVLLATARVILHS